MGVPTSEVVYTSAMPRREDHEVHKDMWGIGGGGGVDPCTGRTGLEGPRSLRLPGFLDSHGGGKVVSALTTGRLYPHPLGDTASTNYYYRLSRTQGHCAAGVRNSANIKKGVELGYIFFLYQNVFLLRQF